jgi:hypothetical protein
MWCQTKFVVGSWVIKLHSMDRLLALPANIRLGWKCLKMTPLLTYYDTEFITAVKSFITQAPG